MGMTGNVEAGRVGNTGEHSSEGHIEECGNPSEKSPVEKAFPKGARVCLCLCARIAEHHVFHIFIFVNQC